MNSTSILSDTGTIVIFTYAPAGLGHLRVTNSLYAGLPGGTKTVLMGSSDRSIERIHKFISIHVITRAIMEWFQRGAPQRVFTFLYRYFLTKRTGQIKQKIEEILEQQVDLPKKVIIVATHFGLAHKLAVVKGLIEKEKGVQIFLVVQVTDDTSQYIWYVPGADLTLVPSKKTKTELLKYGIESNLKRNTIEVLPYPISPLLGKELTDDKYRERIDSCSASSNKEIQFSMPVPGAAVGMEFLSNLITQMQQRTSLARFHIVCKDAPFTKIFLEKIRSYPNIQLHISKHDREIVDLYDQVYSKNVISFEVTKPSEQAFKALFTYKMTGGSFLLFSNPVGRQESDNLEFLRRNKLIPSIKTTTALWSLSENGKRLSQKQKEMMFSAYTHLRGIELPYGSVKAASFIWWCINNNIFEKLISDYSTSGLSENMETRSDGVRLFWEKIASMV